MTAAVSVLDLSKDYVDATGNVVHACQNMTFEAQVGEVFGLLGTNGAGKTTTLRLLSTVLRPTSGDAVVTGCSICSQPDRVRSMIGFLSSDTGVYGRLTAREMLMYFGRLNGLSEKVITDRVDEVTTSLDMHDFLDRRCDKLSTGQRQRVNIARTILHDPAVLIFDEPTAGLDILASASIVEFIRASRRRGRCVLLSTHVMREAEKLCDRVLILHRGRVCVIGTLPELRERYGKHDLEEIFLSAIGEMPLSC